MPKPTIKTATDAIVKIGSETTMDVMIIATKACTHRENLGKDLDSLRIPYRVCFVEDCADLVQKFSIQHSPNLIVDDEVIFRKQPTGTELRAYFGTNTSS